MRVLPPHKYAKLVNDLLDTVIIYQGTQQLRAQISKTLSNYVQPEPEKAKNDGNGKQPGAL